MLNEVVIFSLVVELKLESNYAIQKLLETIRTVFVTRLRTSENKLTTQILTKFHLHLCQAKTPRLFLCSSLQSLNVVH